MKMLLLLLNAVGPMALGFAAFTTYQSWHLIPNWDDAHLAVVLLLVGFGLTFIALAAILARLAD